MKIPAYKTIITFFAKPLASVAFSAVLIFGLLDSNQGWMFQIASASQTRSPGIYYMGKTPFTAYPGDGWLYHGDYQPYFNSTSVAEDVDGAGSDVFLCAKMRCPNFLEYHNGDTKNLGSLPVGEIIKVVNILHDDPGDPRGIFIALNNPLNKVYKCQDGWVAGDCVYTVPTAGTYYLVIEDSVALQTVLTYGTPACHDPASVMLVLDKSSSMNYPFSATSAEKRIDVIKSVVPNFINSIDFNEDKVGLTFFSSTAGLNSVIGTPKADLLREVNNFSVSGNTNITDALHVGGDYFPSDTSKKFIVLVSDGQNTYLQPNASKKATMDAETRAEAQRLQQEGVFIATLALADADFPLLESIASTYPTDPSKRFAYKANNSTEVENFYRLLLNFLNSCDTTPTYSVSLTTTCSASLPISPYKIKTEIKVSRNGMTPISEAYAILAPSGMPGLSYSVSGGAVTGSLDKSVNVRSNAVVTSPNYVVDKRVLTTSALPQSFSFEVDFKNNSDFYRSFSNKFDLYLYIKENNGKTNLQGTSIQKVATTTFNSIDSCGVVFYSTNGGDYRTQEPGSYKDKLGDIVTYGPAGNKYWQASASDQGKFEARDADGLSKGYAPASSFTFEAPTSLGTRSTANRSHGFDVPIDVTSRLVKRDEDTLDEMTEMISGAALYGRVIKYELPQNKSLMTSGMESFVSLNEAEKSITINLTNVKVENALIVLDNDQYPTVYVIDNEANTPDSVIVWCKTASCDLKISSIKYVDSVNQPSAGKVEYAKNGLQSIIKNKTRIYLNYLSGEHPTTPINNSFIAGGFSVPSTRTIELVNGSDTSRNNFYVGMMLTNGFILSSKSSKTDVIKGGVVSRGIVANASGPGTSNLYFKDLPKPFLTIDYDSKYFIKYAELLVSQNPTNNIQYIGL